MKEIAFTNQNFGILSHGIGWCRVNCPHCEKYHSQNFIPNIENGKISYVTVCLRCKEQVTVVANAEFVNRLVNWWDYENKKLEEWTKRKSKRKWQIEIETCKGFLGEESISIGVHSNVEGMGSRHLSKKEAITSVRRYLQTRNIQEKECDFYSDITTKAEVFGGQSLLEFL